MYNYISPGDNSNFVYTYSAFDIQTCKDSSTLLMFIHVYYTDQNE